MMKNVVIVGACDHVGARIAADLEKRNCKVERVLLQGQIGEGIVLDPMSHESCKAAAENVAQKMPEIDMLILNIDGTDPGDSATILDELNDQEMIRAYEYNAIGPMRVLYSFRPLLEKGEGKRVCFVTTAEGSNHACYECGGFGRHMSKAALNMAVNQEFNGMRPQGYTMRMYCKDLSAPKEQQGAYAAEYFLRSRSYEIESYKHSDENRLVLRDAYARELPW